MKVEGDSVSNEQTEQRAGSGLYVDVENLQDDGQQWIQTLIENWPPTAPAPSCLVMYVRADMVELWRVWATSKFKSLEVVVNGIQHFMSSSKNSADIAIAARALSDLLRNRITHAVVLSDDSDFVHLYTAIRDELAQSNGANVPFLWATTNRRKTLSPKIRQFFPDDLLHLITLRPTDYQEPSDTHQSDASDNESLSESPPLARDTWVEMAEEIVRQIPVGTFRSTDCKELIRNGWRGHAMGNAGDPAFGTEFKKNIWPHLQELGVEIANPGNKPIRYEMTEQAKQSLP